MYVRLLHPARVTGGRMIEDRLILVDLLDTPVGEAGKLEAHQKSLLHRAFSVFLYF